MGGMPIKYKKAISSFQSSSSLRLKAPGEISQNCIQKRGFLILHEIKPGFHLPLTLKDKKHRKKSIVRRDAFNKSCPLSIPVLGEPFIEIEDQLQQAHLEAHRLENEIRDYLQLQIGELALQESRKSIELSGSQIEEAKRG
ncbi:MAG: hypothetical protein ALECFALPRED_001319 [Alectoria fallacina]|uniref:Uncharacterized protein n=1 Tax=Alectoria fallacina TaxID=1903189 RepID=A0A8H3FBY8_9LECA|nr:MAG: hypothetical protein ALECFALPRED_001319 [Alectoria fallacina]